jgi:raffinose/stachyose/melibiose transport system permease protein
MTRRLGSQARAALLLLPPALLLFTLFVAWPMLQAAGYSVFNWNGYGRPVEFVGLANYAEVLGSPVFRTALANNGLIIAVSLCVQLPLGLAMALLLVERIPGAVAFRLVFFLPYVLAEVAAGLIWRFMFDGDSGLIASIAQALGAEAPYLLAEPELAPLALLVVITWKYFGFHMMLFVAALQGIDRDLYAAARVDGATSWQVLRLVQLPMLRPVLRLSVFFSVLGSLQLFDLVMPLTAAGPGDATQTLVTFLYTHGIARMRVGFGSAIGVILFAIAVAFALGWQRLGGRDG